MSGCITPQSIGIEYQPTPRDETEMTLAFIANELRDFDQRPVKLSIDAEDRLLEIEKLAHRIRSKLS